MRKYLLTKPPENSQLLTLMKQLIGETAASLQQEQSSASKATPVLPPSTLVRFESTRAAHRPEISSEATNSEIIRLAPENPIRRNCCF